jgi:ubiquinone/menaquinone biosynthesis C-methylase UbiE
MKSKLSFYKNFDKTYYTTGGYDDYLQRFEKQGFDYASKLVKILKPKKSWRFLDVGCGMGGIVLALRKLGYKAWGTEVSPFCLKNSPVKKWIKFGDILNLPFKDNSFEVVLTIDVFCYLNKKEVRQAIKELSRVTKRFLFVETICKASPNANQKTNPDHLRKDKYLLTPKEIIHLLEKEGFQLLGPLFSPAEKVDFNNIFIKKIKS